MTAKSVGKLSTKKQQIHMVSCISRYGNISRNQNPSPHWSIWWLHLVQRALYLNWGTVNALGAQEILGDYWSHITKAGCASTLVQRDEYNYVIVINYSDFRAIDCKVRKCNVIASCAVIDVIESITPYYSKRI